MIPWDETFDELLRRHLPYAASEAEISLDAELVTLGTDSVALLQLMLSIEDAYGIQFPMDQLDGDVFKTARSVWTVTSELRQSTSR